MNRYEVKPGMPITFKVNPRLGTRTDLKGTEGNVIGTEHSDGTFSVHDRFGRLVDRVYAYEFDPRGVN